LFKILIYHHASRLIPLERITKFEVIDSKYRI